MPAKSTPYANPYDALNDEMQATSNSFYPTPTTPTVYVRAPKVSVLMLTVNENANASQACPQTYPKASTNAPEVNASPNASPNPNPNPIVSPPWRPNFLKSRPDAITAVPEAKASPNPCPNQNPMPPWRPKFLNPRPEVPDYETNRTLLHNLITNQIKPFLDLHPFRGISTTLSPLYLSHLRTMKIEPASISPTSYSEDEVLDEAKRLADLLYTIWKAVETENLDKKFWGRVPRVAHWAWETEPKLKRWIKVREARTGGGWRSGGWDRTSSRNTSRDYDGDGDGGGEVSITEEHFEDSGFADGENDEKRVDGEEEEVIVYKGRGTGNVADWRK